MDHLPCLRFIVIASLPTSCDVGLSFCTNLCHGPTGSPWAVLCSFEVLSLQAVSRACFAILRKASPSSGRFIETCFLIERACLRSLSLLPHKFECVFHTRIGPAISTAKTSSLLTILVTAHQSESTRYGLMFPSDFLMLSPKISVDCWIFRSANFSQHDEELYANIGWYGFLKQRHWLLFFDREFELVCSTRKKVLCIIAVVRNGVCLRAYIFV